MFMTIIKGFSILKDILSVSKHLYEAYSKYSSERKLSKEIKDKNDAESTKNLRELLQ